jgi:hypothetical protein
VRVGIALIGRDNAHFSRQLAVAWLPCIAVLIKWRSRPRQAAARSCCRRAILFVGPAHDDPERIVGQRALQRLGLTLARHLQITDH